MGSWQHRYRTDPFSLSDPLYHPLSVHPRPLFSESTNSATTFFRLDLSLVASPGSLLACKHPSIPSASLPSLFPFEDLFGLVGNGLYPSVSPHTAQYLYLHTLSGWPRNEPLDPSSRKKAWLIPSVRMILERSSLASYWNISFWSRCPK